MFKSKVKIIKLAEDQYIASKWSWIYLSTVYLRYFSSLDTYHWVPAEVGGTDFKSIEKLKEHLERSDKRIKEYDLEIKNQLKQETKGKVVEIIKI